MSAIRRTRGTPLPRHAAATISRAHGYRTGRNTPLRSATAHPGPAPWALACRDGRDARRKLLTLITVFELFLKTSEDRVVPTVLEHTAGSSYCYSYRAQGLALRVHFAKRGGPAPRVSRVRR